MKHRPHVSVVISTFNRAPSLAAAVNAVLTQDVSCELSYEVIVVDNNSTDDTPAVIEWLTRADTAGRLRHVVEKRQGVSYGRNAGIGVADGDIIAFTDDDNLAAPNWVRGVKETLDRHPEVSAAGGRVLPIWQSPVPAWIDRRHWPPLALLDLGEAAIYSSAEYPQCLLTANLAIRRAVLQRIGGFSTAFPRCQDHELMRRLWLAGRRALYCPGLVVYAPVAPERLTPRYHRLWHLRHGRYRALMRWEEATDCHGRLRQQPADAPRLLGTPGFVFRDAIAEAAAWAGAMARLDPSSARCHAYRLAYLAGYIQETMHQTAADRDTALLRDLAHLTGRLIRRHGRRVAGGVWHRMQKRP